MVRPGEARQGMDYKEYISSPEWKVKRSERLKFDNGLCVVCHRDATSVHHLHYDSLGKENVENDLASLCEYHHRLFDDIERVRRYSKRVRKSTLVQEQARKVDDHGLGKSKLQTDIIVSVTDAQRANQRPPKQICKRNEEDYFQESENRRRL